MSTHTLSIKAKNIAVVGAGPSGVAAAKYLVAEKAFDQIVLFEQRSKAGGLWIYTPDERDEDMFSIPQTKANQGQQTPCWKPAASSPVHDGTQNADDAVGKAAGKMEPSFLSPVYERLETNIPRHMMAFQDLDWPADTPLFPSHTTTLKYIEDYSKEVQHLVRYNTQVLDIVPTCDGKPSSWILTSLNIRTGIRQEEEFDAIVVANGHFVVPFVPDIQGLQEWNRQHPGRISHSKYFRTAESFVNKKVIVIGASASGTDISQQISLHSQRPLLWSTRSSTLFSHHLSDPARSVVPEIVRFVPETRGVVFKDGRSADDIDAVVFATGYFYSLPFLERVRPKLIGDGSRVHHTYEHVFFTPQPTLSFLVLTQRVIPFVVAEAQAAVIARVYSGRLSLPAKPMMEAWERERMAAVGDGRDYHTLPVDGIYINAMSEWAMRAGRRRGKEDGWPGEALDNDGQGKMPPMFTKQDFWCRENFPALRKAFTERGDDRVHVRSIEELGFSYERYMEERQKDERDEAPDGERSGQTGGEM